MVYPLPREDLRARTAPELLSARAKPTPRIDVDTPRPVEERGVRWTVTDGSGELGATIDATAWPDRTVAKLYMINP